ncbi:MAG: hypothetical protein CO073_04415 [Candidatus Komeilibacteria bacterium CG_4_9_14_0_8_um_filter_36_9]|uniref:Uncharacterized protein n=1 Tax=Candidatus Komeilibacteria bacterium CG_4_9_14_0_8_um_filter_36_9 TaxID=1974473 RepID=A0A2M8DQ32_9BACT|nr:MAG: hypothetical protein CO073_04415 [Candidatus Komeilibacteria bacterium CG_4_9_14_0_8_um_filter_36_9]
MNIGSKSGWPSSSLSNFAPHPFVIDGIECASMEGFLQSLKFDKPHVQVEVCTLTGLAAKLRGQKRNSAWKRVQKLWWQGQEFDRGGEEYQQLLDRAYKVLATNPKFQRALLATNNAVLTHSVGGSKKQDTVLTEHEFCSRLMRIRK